MFEKLLSLVPYNPGLLPQLAFYSHRMREEASIRRTGTIFLILAFMIQFFAVLSPPQSTFASRDPENDVVKNGFSTPREARQKCKDNTQNFKHILRHYGIDCESIGGDPVSLTVSTINNYYSMGRKANANNSKKSTVTIDGATLYWRPLTHATDADSLNAVRAVSNDGTTWYILFSCGNLVSRGVPKASGPIKQTSSVIPTTNTPQSFTPSPATPAPAPAPAPTPAPLPTPPVTPKCKYSPSLEASDVNCKPCDKANNNTDTTACLTISKSAINNTVGGDANNTTANPGDVITYTLKASNDAKEPINNFQFREELGDVLMYADVVNLFGGSKDAYGVVTWPNQDIPAGSSIGHQITVKVKNPVPNTPLDPANSQGFDLIMTNIYGNTVNIRVPASPSKQVEVAAATLPNTGPGTTLMIGAFIVISAGYFYSRATLLARESDIAVKESARA